jgi:predicted transcriptional regulator of viral defense system
VLQIDAYHDNNTNPSSLPLPEIMPEQTGTRPSDRLRQLQARGRYTFTIEELEDLLGGTLSAQRSALRRLKERGLITSPRRGFYVLVPPEYSSTGSPPATWFLDDLMRYLQQPYYVGLLSAAALHGAAHQQPQVFQVLTSKPTGAMTAGQVRIEYFAKRDLELSPTARLNTPTGTMTVATAEITVFDLLRHLRACGYLDNVATVIAELADVLRPAELAAAAGLAHVSEIQRAGYLLELVGREPLATILEATLEARPVQLVPLLPGPCASDVPRSDRWKLLLNTTVDPEL